MGRLSGGHQTGSPLKGKLGMPSTQRFEGELWVCRSVSSSKHKTQFMFLEKNSETSMGREK